MNKTKQRQIMRVMGAHAERQRQPSRSPLEMLMDEIDPWAEGREETEMDVWEGNAPVKVEPVIDADGNLVEWEQRTTTTARSPRGDEDHATNGKTIFTELIPREEE